MIQLEFFCVMAECPGPFRVGQGDFGQANKQVFITCPNCKQRLVKMVNPFYNAERLTKVLFPGENNSLPLIAGYLLAMDTGEQYPFLEGSYSIGRASQEAKSDVMINTQDKELSRLHAVLTVRNVRGKYVFYLSDAGSVNSTYHNGSQISQGKEVMLTYKDLIKMGQSNFMFIPHANYNKNQKFSPAYLKSLLEQ